MEGYYSALTLLAEAGLGLAGFTGIVIGISPNPAHWNMAHKVRTQNLLAISLSVIFFVFVLFGLMNTSMISDDIWRVGSLLQVILLSVMLPRMITVRRRLPSGTSGALNPVVFMLVFCGSTLNIVTQLANTFLAFPGGKFIYMYSGFIFLLSVTCLMFFLLVFSRQNQNTDVS